MPTAGRATQGSRSLAPTDVAMTLSVRYAQRTFVQETKETPPYPSFSGLFLEVEQDVKTKV